MGDEEFADYIASRLAGLPGVLAVSLGGSRASGANWPDSDWDFAVYYRGRFDPDDLCALGWPGEVSAIGGWGGGVFNGGAWLRVEGRPVDVHYRDLDDVEHQIAEAREGRFGIERLMFHLAGIHQASWACCDGSVACGLSGGFEAGRHPGVAVE